MKEDYEAILKICLETFNVLKNQKVTGEITTYEIAKQIEILLDKHG